MFKKREGALTKAEKPIVKALIAQGWRNQDIQALVNLGRTATINSARITEVKQNKRIKIANNAQVDFYRLKKKSYDPQTGLNLYDDERLIRARETMGVAVQTFNSPTIKFKSETFAVLANIAWTYLLHEYYVRKGLNIVDDGGRSMALSEMLNKNDCPVSVGVKNNLLAIKKIRDNVEHQLLGKADVKWLALFQACCLNFEKTICDLFGEELSLSKDQLGALQFNKMSLDQLSTIQNYEIPANIKAIDADIRSTLKQDELEDLEYEFKVVYTMTSTSKSRSHIQFLQPTSPEAKDVKSILVKHELADDKYPYKPGKIVQLVCGKTDVKFTSHNHTQAWKKHKVRPTAESK